MFLYFGDERSANLEWWSNSKSKFTVKKKPPATKATGGLNIRTD